MRSRLHLLIPVMALFSASTFGGVNRWTSHGPEGGSVYAMVVDPTEGATVYAGTDHGVYKSENEAALWKPMTNGLDRRVSALMIAPEDHSRIYAGTSDGKVFQSRDGGANWIELGQAGRRQIRSFATTGQVIYAATENGLWRSRDGGANWEVDSAFQNVLIHSVAVSPVGDLFVTRSGVVSLSQNGGQTWARLETQLSFAIAFDDSGSIYLAGERGLSKSTDRGKTWQFISGPPNRLNVSALHISKRGRIYLGAYQGLFESNGDGQWIVPEGARDLTSINAVVGSESGRLYVGSWNLGIYTKIENSVDWMAANRGLDLAVTSDVAVEPFHSSTVYAATQTGLFKSDDAGESWKQIDPKAKTAVALNPFAPNVVYAGGRVLQKSVDAGASWKEVRPSRVSALAVAPSNSSTVYAALAEGMSRSTDGGESWTKVMSGMLLPYYFYYDGFDASAIAVDPSNSSVVYVAQDAGLHKTENAGELWKQISPAWISALAVDPTDSSVVYRGSGFEFTILLGVAKSHDAGKSWEPVGLQNQFVRALVINPADPSVLYAGTEAGEVYRSDSGGSDWKLFSDGLRGDLIRRLSIDSSGYHLYAATVAGVFDYLTSEIDIEPMADDSRRLAQLLNQLFAQSPAARSGFVLPVTGLGPGANGTFFKTDMTLRNDRATDQDVLIGWLAQGNTDGRVPFFRLTLKPLSGQEVNIPNIVERLGMSGLGSLVGVAVDPAGNLDPGASIDGSARICVQAPDQRAMCQSIEAVRADRVVGHSAARAGGLRHDARFRTNVGIVNLDAIGHQFTITATGERHVEKFNMFVPPFSLAQTPIPDSDYGELTLTVASENRSAPWTFYGSSIENLSGAGMTSVGTP
jgi:photosystem II stability/assembly factor-like uncharacterized protein